MSFFAGLNITSLTNALSAAGVAASNIPGAISSLVSNSVASQAQPLLNAIIANAANPAVVAAEVVKVEEIAGLPAAVVPLLSELTLPGQDALKIQQLCQAIQTTLNAAPVTL